MTPQSFPARQNDRRIAVINRIEAQLASGVKLVQRLPVPLSAGDRTRLSREADTLALRIRPAARDLRSKKLKADGWTAARAAHRRGKIA